MSFGITQTTPLKYVSEISPEGAVKLRFQLSAEEASRFRNLIAPAAQGQVKLCLPALAEGEWVLYWKSREGDCRALYAHPESQEWVGTIALTEEAYGDFLARLQAGKSFALSQVSPLVGFSNLDLEFEFLV